MEALEKLRLFAREMDLEPTEEAQPGRAPQHIPLPVVSTGAQGLAQQAPAGGRTKQAQPPLPCGAPRAARGKEELGIYQAVTGGKTVPLLKTMLTSACERNCTYCPFRAGRNYRRATFKPEEMAKTFMQMQRAGMVDGLFLSSGIIKGGAATQDRLLDTAEILRHKHGFRGYLHLKIMPGAERAQVERAMQLADRLSVNLEAPNTKRLQKLAPMKIFLDELLQPLQWIEDVRRNQPAYQSWNGRWPSTVTQFVVGAVGESDLELLSTADYLYRRLRLQRTYFSAFRPIADTPLEEQPAENPWREHRLYQASFLLRDYNFDMEEMPFDDGGRLPLHVDPKLGWAQRNIDNPVELNQADRETLLRVPGIGPKGAAAIIRARKQGKLRKIEDLRQIGVVTTRLAPFVLLDGERPEGGRQMRLF